MNQTQAQHIWKIFDDMTVSDPHAYQKFIQKNIQIGIQEIQIEKQEKIKEFLFYNNLLIP
ncbi:unnamed protein product [Paramecium sonneborni]|uniref:Uncharacterized protein n=1 Tax=Paramecium sonneborni TaxID=65129 RepID=A0A8S1RI21_9CILI|nr:unnamed protein product [Paramecium sonneborni]